MFNNFGSLVNFINENEKNIIIINLFIIDLNKNKIKKVGIYCIVILVIIVAWLWPVVIFKNEIIFDKAKFTEEWIKIFLTSIIIAIGFKYLGKIQKENSSMIFLQKVKTRLADILVELKKEVKSELLSELQKTIETIKSFDDDFEKVFKSELQYINGLTRNVKIGNITITKNDKQKLYKILRKFINSL